MTTTELHPKISEAIETPRGRDVWPWQDVDPENRLGPRESLRLANRLSAEWDEREGVRLVAVEAALAPIAWRVRRVYRDEFGPVVAACRSILGDPDTVRLCPSQVQAAKDTLVALASYAEGRLGDPRPAWVARPGKTLAGRIVGEEYHGEDEDAE
jgi:hypothetical protein